MKVKKGVVWTVSILVILGIASAIVIPRVLQAVNRKEPQTPLLMVDTGVPTVGEITKTTELMGSVQPDEMVSVIPKISGEVLETYFEEGDTVQAGDVLLLISDEAVRTQIDQAQDAVNLAQVNLNSVNGGTMEQQLTQLEASLASAKLTLDNAEKNLARMESLFQTGAISQVELEQAQTTYDAAKLQYDSSQKTYDLTKGQVHEEQQAAAQAQLNQAQTGLQAAQQQLSYTRVTAPISGTIEKKSVSVHGMASPQSPAYVISNKNQMTVQFFVSETVRENIRIGDALTMEKNGAAYTGEIMEIGEMVDTSTGLFLVKASIQNTQDLYTGSTVKVTLTTQRADNAILIPLGALYREAGNAYVYVYENGQAKKTAVQTGMYNDEFIQITEGLTANSTIITSWSSQLQDALPVQVMSSSDAPSSSLSSASSEEETA